MGDYLKVFLDLHRKNLAEFGAEAGISANELAVVLRSPSKEVLRLSGELLGRICHAMDLKLDQAMILVEKTLRLIFLANVGKAAMARYTYNHKGDKEDSMKRARQELLLKASAIQPFVAESDPKLNKWKEQKLRELKNYYEQL